MRSEKPFDTSITLRSTNSEAKKTQSWSVARCEPDDHRRLIDRGCETTEHERNSGPQCYQDSVLTPASTSTPVTSSWPRNLIPMAVFPKGCAKASIQPRIVRYRHVQRRLAPHGRRPGVGLPGRGAASSAADRRRAGRRAGVPVGLADLDLLPEERPGQVHPDPRGLPRPLSPASISWRR